MSLVLAPKTAYTMETLIHSVLRLIFLTFRFSCRAGCFSMFQNVNCTNGHLTMSQFDDVPPSGVPSGRHGPPRKKLGGQRGTTTLEYDGVPPPKFTMY